MGEARVNDGADIKMSPRVWALVKRMAMQEGEEPGPVLEAIVRYGLVYRAKVRAGGRIVKPKEVRRP